MKPVLGCGIKVISNLNIVSRNSMCALFGLLMSFHHLDAGQSNLLTNADVETGSGSPNNWGTQVAPGNPNPTFSWATDKSVSSTRSLKTVVTANGTADWRQTNISVNPNIRYRLRAHIYATSIVSGSHAVEVQWFAGSTYLGRNVLSAAAANKWVEEIQENILPPAGANVAHILLRTYKIGTYYFDDISLLRSDNQLILNDGKFPMGLYSLPSVGLINNGDADFKDVSNGNNPSAWGASKDPNATAIFEWDSVRKVSGKALKITMGSNGFPAHWGQAVSNIDPAKRYRFSAAIYASNSTAGSHSAEVQWFNGNQYLGRLQLAIAQSGTWKIVSQNNIAPPSGANTAYILMRGYSVGDYSFDTIRFEEDRSEVNRVTEAVNAGFNFIMGGASTTSISSGGAKLVHPFSQTNYTNTTSLTADVNSIKNHAALRFYHPPDEMAWWETPISSSYCATAYQTIKSADGTFDAVPHRVWLNHAPRGTDAQPNNFSLLKPYSQGADIVSMDIYPVPNGNHSNLANQSISCVGDYVDILYNQVVSDNNVQIKPIWMVLQGSSFSDYSPLNYSHSVQVQWFDAGDDFISAEILAGNKNNQWVTVSQTNIVPPNNAVKAVIVLRALAPGTYRFDNISLAENGVARTTNGNIESGSGSNPTGWTRVVASGSVTQTWDTALSSSASHSLKTVITGNWGNADWQQGITGIDPAKMYSLSAHVHTDNASSYPRPTWLQTRFMAYNAIIHGSRGLAYWGVQYIRASDSMWEDLKGLASEIELLSDVLAMPTSFRNVQTTNANLETLLLSSATDSRMYLFVANRSNSSLTNVTISWSGLPTPTVSEFLEGQSVTVTNNTIVRSFDPYQVNVFELTKTP